MPESDYQFSIQPSTKCIWLDKNDNKILKIVLRSESQISLNVIKLIQSNLKALDENEKKQNIRYFNIDKIVNEIRDFMEEYSELQNKKPGFYIDICS
ncbi:MAG: hypothetical protein CL760_05790 [Chloroflexi bacterium]|nr:hypothetical protein [Chloroflexota bacterium]|tara:strand:- start:6772 stop:7062 length:291 start_codon:yes stop_codon:yes gene_type:complete